MIDAEKPSSEKLSEAPAQGDASEEHLPGVVAGLSAWLLDAFDFFLVTFCLTAFAKDFHKSDAEVALVITLTLIFRPLGGFVFGVMADHYGRRLPLMINIGAFAVAEIFTSLAPSYTILLVVRGLFGFVMGGCWGVGASLAMESAPVHKRGLFSGLLQEGYAIGNVLAALCFYFLFGSFGWRRLFLLGSLPAVLLLLYIHFFVKESAAWKKSFGKRQTWKQQSRALLLHWKLFLYLLAFMTTMLFVSHGTQDMYPTFLQRQWHFSSTQRAAITGLSGIGAILGGIIVGHFSDGWGRRRTILTAFIFGAAAVAIWAHAPNEVLLILGAFVMQFMVQGAWGVVPAHLTELSPASVRALLPGFAYQCGAVIASAVVFIEAIFAERTSYATAMALTAICAFVLASIVTILGPEDRGRSFLS